MSGASPTSSAATSDRPIAAFDFDGTLLNGDCLLILHRLVRSPIGRLLDGLRLIPALLLWKSGLRSTSWFKELFLQMLLTPAMQGRSLEEQQKLLGSSLPQVLWQRLKPEALARLDWHRQQGHQLVIVSASPRCLLQPIADRLGVHLIATETTDPINGERIQLHSANCKGLEKIRRLSGWLQRPLDSINLHAYGDSRGDRELLQAATHPHWRSFEPTTRAYPEAPSGGRLFAVAAVVLLAAALAGLLQLDPATTGQLLNGLTRLPSWTFTILAVLALSYAGRLWRFRLLLRAEGIGHASRRECWVWLQGFALTATPGKVGELARVQQLHQQLGYPRMPLLHAFLAERLCDAVAVVIWLTLLVPVQLQQRLSQWSPASLGITSLIGLIGGTLSWWMWSRRDWWRKHLPSGRLARACIPGSGVSLAIWGVESMLLWLLVQAISPATPISAGQAISIYLLSGTAGMASLLPGGLGVNEATTTVLLHQAGIPTSLALGIAILRRLCSVWLITAVATAASLVRRDV